MSIPLDRLYHYIDSVAQKISGDNVLIYRFFPHGSKNIEDLTLLGSINSIKEPVIKMHLVCHDQEPLNYNLYVDCIRSGPSFTQEYHYILTDTELEHFKTNLRESPHNVYDKCLLLHSELNSKEVEKYALDQFVPVYYWNHAILAQDWFRYAQHITQSCTITNKKFLMYNRAWTGTREYRLKMADLLVDYQLVDQSLTRCAFTDYDTKIHYSQHQFSNPQWRPKHQLETHYENNDYPAHASADFNLKDYEHTDIEVVLETLFDDSRIHLTEKTLRPIAVGQPFLLVGTAGSLQYLRNYGFKTFDNIIDESYDNIADPMQRLIAVVEIMHYLKNLSPVQYQETLNKMKNIAEYNKKYFFSDVFTKKIKQELFDNLSAGIENLLSTNTYQRYLRFRSVVFANKDYVEWRKNNLSTEANQWSNELYHQILTTGRQ